MSFDQYSCPAANSVVLQKEKHSKLFSALLSATKLLIYEKFLTDYFSSLEAELY
jgi:hypothetical protein